jgi:hypothetical protein
MREDEDRVFRLATPGDTRRGRPDVAALLKPCQQLLKNSGKHGPSLSEAPKAARRPPDADGRFCFGLQAAALADYPSAGAGRRGRRLMDQGLSDASYDRLAGMLALTFGIALFVLVSAFLRLKSDANATFGSLTTTWRW